MRSRHRPIGRIAARRPTVLDPGASNGANDQAGHHAWIETSPHFPSEIRMHHVSVYIEMLI
jgi:hypothetical protein